MRFEQADVEQQPDERSQDQTGRRMSYLYSQPLGSHITGRVVISGQFADPLQYDLTDASIRVEPDPQAHPRCQSSGVDPEQMLDRMAD